MMPNILNEQDIVFVIKDIVIDKDSEKSHTEIET